MFNGSKTDPAAWVGKVKRIAKRGIYTVGSAVTVLSFCSIIKLFKLHAHPGTLCAGELPIS